MVVTLHSVYMKKLLLIIFLFIGSTLYGAINRYSVLTLENLTPYTVHYIYGWGDGSESGDGRNSIGPYKKYTHWWEFGYPGEDWAPWFWLKIDGDRTWSKLGSFFSPNTTTKSARFYFVDHKYGDGTHKVKLIYEDSLPYYR